MSEQLGVLFLVLFVVAGGVCIYLSITMSHRVQAGINRWRNVEKQTLETELKQRAEETARLEFEQWKQAHEEQIRADAIQRSLAVTKGKVAEQKGGAPGADNASSEPKGQEMSYAARVSLDRTQMQIDDNLVNLGLGMAVTVEIKTGERTVLSYLLSPIMRYKHDTLRER